MRKGFSFRVYGLIPYERDLDINEIHVIEVS